MNEDLIQKIEASSATGHNEDDRIEKKKNMITWLVFMMNGSKFAIQSSQVQEIIRDVSVYSLPFVPRYIEGVMNRRGEPYTVIDPLVLLDIAKQEKNQEEETGNADTLAPVFGEKEDPVALFLVLNVQNDQVCLHIDDILFFHDTAEDELRVFIDGNKEISFYKGTIEFNHEEIPVLNADAFEFRLKKDLQNG